MTDIVLFNALLASEQDVTGPIWATETEDLDCTLLRWRPGHEISEHVNDEVDVVTTVLAGSATLLVDGFTVSLKAGAVVAIPKGASRSLVAGPEGVVYLNVHKRRRRLMPTGTRPVS